MNLFFSVSSIVITALFTVYMIGCASSDDDTEAPVAVLESATSSINVTDVNFTKSITASELPLVVYFWTDWCPPCKWMAPIIEEIAFENRETFRIAKLDVDRNPQTVRKYQIEAMPTLITFRDGKITGRFVGGMQKAGLVQRIRQAIKTQEN